MNDRITKLALQANLTEVIDSAYQERNDWQPFVEKFAELIVKKCMDVAKYHTPDTEECEHTWLIHDKIAKHFGVEE